MANVISRYSNTGQITCHSTPYTRVWRVVNVFSSCSTTGWSLPTPLLISQYEQWLIFSAGIVIPVRSLATPLLIPEYGEWSMFSAVIILQSHHLPVDLRQSRDWEDDLISSLKRRAKLIWAQTNSLLPAQQVVDLAALWRKHQNTF